MIYFQSLTQKQLAEILLPLSKVRNYYEYSEDQLKLKKIKQSQMRAKQIFHWVYQRYVTQWDEMTDLSFELREWLKAHIEIFELKEKTSHQSLDGTFKVLWNLNDQKTIESVVIPARSDKSDKKSFTGSPASEGELNSEKWSRLTICISSQVGCAMACKFCLTGIQGLDRHLQVHEIVSQVFQIRKKVPLTNIVFMGMGEPLHNLENIIQACEILLDEDGMNFSKRKITVSTSGLVPAIEELGKRVDVSLAISLNATTDEVRSLIMPVNKKWNIKTLLQACRNYPLTAKRKITFEYVLLKGINDSLEDAQRLVQLLRGIPNKVNLIPFNEHIGSEFKRPDDNVIYNFQKYLMDRQMTATVRISRGRDILAACGQLRSLFGTARGSERHKDYNVEVSAKI